LSLPLDHTTKPIEATKALLDSAREIFVAEGVKGLSVRRVAQHAGCTTMAVYSRFGGKEGLLSALFDEGFERLAQAQGKVDIQLPPAERVVGLCRAYRATAQAFPHHYALMLGSFSGEHQPSPESSARAMSTLQTLMHSVSAALPTTKGSDQRSKEVAYQLFAFCHGWVSLERIGFFDDVEENGRCFDRAIQALLGS
jgi:AcrR family transcriptional regulator